MPLSIFSRDSMHIMFASGSVLQVEIYCLLKAVRRRDRDIWQKWASGLQAWAQGKGGGTSPTWIFSNARLESTLSTKHFVGSAGDVLAVLPFLRYWVHRELPKYAGMEARARSFENMCRLSDLYLQGKRTGAVHKDTWVEAVSAAIRSHVDAYTDALVKPKHHYLFHACDQASEDNVWLDAFVLERRHRLIKSTADNIYRISDIERTVNHRAVETAIEEANAQPHSRFKRWRTPELDAVVGPQRAANATVTLTRFWLYAFRKCVRFDGVRGGWGFGGARSERWQRETRSRRSRVCSL